MFLLRGRKQMKKTTIVISECKRDRNAFWPSKFDEKGKEIKGAPKVLKKGWKQYVEITELPNGKKTSVTRHGPLG